MSNYRTTHIDKIMIAFPGLIAVAFLVRVGNDLTRHWYGQAVIDFLLAGFMVALLTAVVASHISELRNRVIAAERPDPREFADKLISALDEAFDRKPGGIQLEGLNGLDITKLGETFMECVKAVTDNGHRAPTIDEQQMIVAQFHDLTGAYARFVGEQSDEKGNIQISSDPFPAVYFKQNDDGSYSKISETEHKELYPEAHVPGRSAAHEAARKRGDAARKQIPVKDGDKPLTASQKRRMAAIEADKLAEAKRIERNAKRREARQAKKNNQ